MKKDQDTPSAFTDIDNPSAIEGLLDTLTEPGAASLVLDQPGSEPLPVVVVSLVPGESLTLDVSAVREVVPALKRGAGLRLLGQGLDGMLRTPVLSLLGCDEQDGRLQCRCEYPGTLRQYQRRNSYRAVLRLGMAAGVLLRDLERPVTFQGDLRDLSMDGCLIELAPNAAETVERGRAPLELEFCFPNGSRFVTTATAQRRVPDKERGVLAVGFSFASHSADIDRQLWYYVREIERESARRASTGATALQVSPLFQVSETVAAVGLRHALSYATPMARRLAPVASYLDTQILELRDGGMIDGVSLSRAVDLLLRLLDEDRQAVLFAVRCLPRESQLVQHSVAVAVRLADIARDFDMPRELLKSLSACALLHDLGKTLLPPEVLSAPERDESQARAYRTHPHLLLPRLEACQWLSEAVREAVVEGINERLDGSGYPAGWRGDRLHELTRLAAIVAEADRLERPGPGRSPLAVPSVYRYLARSTGQFDGRWVERYASHFGLLPVGTLVRFPGEVLAWVQGIDADGGLEQVQLSAALVPPGEGVGDGLGDGLGEVVRGTALQRLGLPEPLAPPARDDALLY